MTSQFFHVGLVTQKVPAEFFHALPAILQDSGWLTMSAFLGAAFPKQFHTFGCNAEMSSWGSEGLELAIGGHSLHRGHRNPQQAGRLGNGKGVFSHE